MATHAIGKLKFNLSKQGLAYRWGDGEIHRLFAGKSEQADVENEENYTGYEGEEYVEDGYADPGYDDEYDDGADAGYADDPGFDDGYEDDGYADDGYEDDPGYDDDYEDDGEYAEDGYDDGYDDEAYDDETYDEADGYDDGYEDGYDEGGEYDDRYSEEDADGGYGEGYDEGYYENESPLMRYVDENDWVTYLLLFLFPPLGIYLLWRRNRFEKPIRYAISAASAIWFIVALVLLFTNLFGGASDSPTDATITLAPSATVSALDLDGASGDGLDVSLDNLGDGDGDSEDTTDTSDSSAAEPTVEPSPTPLTNNGASGASGAAVTSDYVYSPATGLYYHSKSDCSNIDQGVSVSRVPKDVAENNRKQSACPVCIGAAADGDTTTYYATRGGTYYHVDRVCQGMTGATTYTKEAAERAGKTPCPVCILKTAQSLQSGKVKFITSSTTDRSNINVYSTKNGRYYHMTSGCSGMTGATRGSLKNALLAGKEACPTCCKAAGSAVYCTKNGEKYHLDKSCSGMTNAMEVTLAEAMVMGKKRCDVCIKSGALPTASQLAKQADEASDETFVYGTPKGRYYHTDEHCSGMKDAQRYTLKSMLLQKRAACPICASASNTVVYAKEGGTYYHSYATCSGMSNASSGTMAQAIAAGYKRCPRCWSETSSNGTLSTNAGASTTSAAATATAANTYVYATQAGSYYHLLSNCSGMKNANRITLKQAINAGKKACPTCAGSANRKVYSNDGGKNYHSAPVCKESGMKNGQARTLAQALMMNQTACKYCIGRRSGGSSSSASTASAQKVSSKTVQSIKAAASKLRNSHTYKSGKSGIKVYARADGKYYHRRKNCSGMTHASRITLEQAMNYGKRACPVCCSTARRTVYATRGGKYYHYSKTHAGSGARSGSLASALGYGYDPCPYCVTKTKSLSRVANYKSGTSGIKVYTTTGGKYYHSKRNCSDMKNPARVTLETAMNYGKKPCPKCMATASKKVYSSSGDSYYHYYKAHARAGAQAGTLAQARALGKKLCPTCAKGRSAGVTVTSSSTAKKIAKAIAAAQKLSASSVSSAAKAKAVSYTKALASQMNYTAPGNTKVYVDLKGKQYYYYHKSTKCSKTGMTKGTKITLQYAKDWGYKACPFCQPPTTVEKQ